MFANKGRLKVALLVVGFLVTSLGMYAGFQVQEAEALSGCNSGPKNGETRPYSTTKEEFVEHTFVYFYASCKYCGRSVMMSGPANVYNVVNVTGTEQYIINEWIAITENRSYAGTRIKFTSGPSGVCLRADCGG